MEDTKGAIIIRISKENRQHNGQKSAQYKEMLKKMRGVYVSAIFGHIIPIPIQQVIVLTPKCFVLIGESPKTKVIDWFDPTGAR